MLQLGDALLDDGHIDVATRLKETVHQRPTTPSSQSRLAPWLAHDDLGDMAVARYAQERSGDDPAARMNLRMARDAIFRDRPINVFQIKATYWIGR